MCSNWEFQPGRKERQPPTGAFPDLVTQKLLKAVLRQAPAPYPMPDLEDLARHCTEAENAAKKVER